MPDDLNVDVASRARVTAAWTLLLGLIAHLLRRAPRGSGALVGVAAGVLAVLDRPLLVFLARKRGWVFAARAEPWQLLSHLYAGGSFAVALARHLAAGRPSG